jgi:hypothetical protein
VGGSLEVVTRTHCTQLARARGEDMKSNIREKRKAKVKLA